MKRSAFTLIELLVTISVIGLLLAILVPVLHKAKEQGNTMVCRSNLRQYGWAAKIYWETNNGNFSDPRYTLYQNEADPKCCQWHNAALTPDGLLWSYRDPIKVHMCPTFYHLSKQRGQSHPYHDSSIPIKPRYAYSMNAYLGLKMYDGALLNVTQVNNPAEVFLFSEENMWEIPSLSTAVLNDTVLLSRYPPYEPDNISDTFGTFHSAKRGDLTTGTANVVFVDGHVGSVHIGADNIDDGFRLAWPRKSLPQMYALP